MEIAVYRSRFIRCLGYNVGGEYVIPQAGDVIVHQADTEAEASYTRRLAGKYLAGNLALTDVMTKHKHGWASAVEWAPSVVSGPWGYDIVRWQNDEGGIIPAEHRSRIERHIGFTNEAYRDACAKLRASEFGFSYTYRRIDP